MKNSSSFLFFRKKVPKLNFLSVFYREEKGGIKMKKKILGISTLVIMGAYAATFMVDMNSFLSVKASTLDSNIEQQLDIMYGDNWEQILEQVYGENWRQQLETKYNTSINECVMMEIERLNDNGFWQQCLDNMENLQRETQPQSKNQKSSSIEDNQLSNLSSDINEDQTQQAGGWMSVNNPKKHCHD